MPFLRKYNTLLVTGTTAIRIPLIKRSVVDFAVGADYTPAAGDVKISIDATAAANVTNLPTAVTYGNTAMWEFILTAAELSCKQAVVTIADAATKAVEDQSFIVETYGNASAMYAADVSLANLPANITQLLGTAWLTPAVAGTPDVNAKQLGGATVTATTSVTIPAASTLATTAGAVGSVTGNVGGNVVGSVGSVATAGISQGSLAASAQNAIADAILDRNMATGTDSGTDSTAVRTPRQALRALRNKATISGGVATITKEDDVTASWTAGVTTAAGNPISGVDPT